MVVLSFVKDTKLIALDIHAMLLLSRLFLHLLVPVPVLSGMVLFSGHSFSN
jgi:hypothetical protein